jgi:glucosamine-6-phosphate deaminase
VAYQVSGNIAVFDEDDLRFADFASDFNATFGIDVKQTEEIEKHLEQSLRNKKPGQVDLSQVQKIKGVIRRGEARAAGRYCGIPYERLHFLDLPFYETGTVGKKPIGEDDVRIVAELLEEIQPHQVYAAGDLSDPQGTHRVYLQAIFAAIEKVKQSKWYEPCEVWLYRGAWQEWEPERIELAVPISPDELARKRNAIFKHQSQKDRAMYPGSDPREFWQRAEDRNRETVELYNKLGLAEYEAIEIQWLKSRARSKRAGDALRRCPGSRYPFVCFHASGLPLNRRTCPLTSCAAPCSQATSLSKSVACPDERWRLAALDVGLVLERVDPVCGVAWENQGGGHPQDREW